MTQHRTLSCLGTWYRQVLYEPAAGVLWHVQLLRATPPGPPPPLRSMLARIACGLTLVSSVAAHGSLISPRSRNSVDCETRDPLPGCLSFCLRTAPRIPVVR